MNKCYYNSSFCSLRNSITINSIPRVNALFDLLLARLDNQCAAAIDVILIIIVLIDNTCMLTYQLFEIFTHDRQMETAIRSLKRTARLYQRIAKSDRSIIRTAKDQSAEVSSKRHDHNKCRHKYLYICNNNRYNNP